MKNSIIILDFGSQYTQLIAKRVRQLGVYSEILPFNTTIEQIQKFNPIGIILSGGPASVYDSNSPTLNLQILNLKIPILGICYGMQLLIHLLGGKVIKADKQEFGKVEISLEVNSSDLFLDVPNKSLVLMSHGDSILNLPDNFKQLATTNSAIAAVADVNKQFYGVQFHPEVTHSTKGFIILENFIFKICKAHKNWVIKNYITDVVQNIKDIVANKQVILGLSGGIDSTVCALLIHKAIGNNLTCVFVNTGLLRKNETHDVMKFYKNYNLNILCVDAKQKFLTKLQNITDPEAKRKIIGKEFINIFKNVATKMHNVEFLAQGTIYPDVIESKSLKGPSHTIKSHHNVGGLPSDMPFTLLEPLRDLFKDEVIIMGKALGLGKEILKKHPFPGPGLAIRIIGEISQEKISILQEADNILIEELTKQNLYNTLNQAFVVLLPIKSVGVMGDLRTYEATAIIRAVTTKDFMTATWAHLPYSFLENVSSRITNEVRGINRVCYDISSKPPSTIEWE